MKNIERTSISLNDLTACVMDPYRLKLLSLSNEITDRELVELKFICKQHIPVGVMERIRRPFGVVR